MEVGDSAPDGLAGDTQRQQEGTFRSSSTVQGQACQRCRQHKLRCTRESPKCTRCERASAQCTYPPPPDRKLLAAQRVRRSRFRPFQGPRSSNLPPEKGNQSYDPPASVGERSSPSAEGDANGANGFLTSRADEVQIHRPWITSRNPQSSHIHADAASKPTPVPSQEVAALLIEMYFTRVYNATLLFHKEKFLSDYAANRVPTFVTQAIFASASIFLPKPSLQSHVDDSEIELGISALSTSDFSNYAHEWATVATEQALMHAVKPSIENIQACQVLSLYWFSKNVIERAHILTLLAYTSCRLLGFHVPQAASIDGDDFAAELRRRCLWSCWMTACISQDNASFKAESWSEVIGLPLPADEASFGAGKPESIEAFNEVGKVILLNGSHSIIQTSIMGELVKLFSLWWEIQRFVKRHQDGHSSDPADRLQIFLKLDRRLEIMSENLHPDFKYTSPSSFTSPKLEPYMLFQLQCLHRLCACALHSSLVPLFSSTPPNPKISKKLIRMCAEEAVKHSIITLDMATVFLSIRPDKSRLSSMTGYAMFVSSAIQIRSLGAQGKLRTHAGHLKAAITILEQLKEYWSPLRDLWARLEAVSSFAGLDINSFAISRTSMQPASADLQTDIEQIVSPEAVSESGPGADLYTYVDRREPKISSQQASPADAGPQNTAAQTFSSPRNGLDSMAGSHSSQRRTTIINQSQPVSGGLGQANSMSDMSTFASAYPHPSDHMSEQMSFQRGVDHHLGTGTSEALRAGDMLHSNMAGTTPQMQLYGTPTNPQTMWSAESDTFRPMLDGFDTMNGMMGMDLTNDDDDFWWARSLGSVRIL